MLPVVDQTFLVERQRILEVRAGGWVVGEAKGGRGRCAGLCEIAIESDSISSIHLESRSNTELWFKVSLNRCPKLLEKSQS